MRFERLKKIISSLCIATALIFSVTVASSTDASAQSRYRWDRHREYSELNRIRRFDRDRQLRYRYRGPVRTVGFYDRFGRFHVYGFYDRFGRLHRY
jgi:hypothetical protein